MPTLSASFSTVASSAAIIVPSSQQSQQSLTVSYAALHGLVSNFQQQLAGIGITMHSAVSIALPNNLEFIVSFLAVAAQRAVACPLNPAYKQPEFEFYIDDIKSGLVIVPRGAVAGDAPAVRAARGFGVGIAEAWWDENLGELVFELKERGALKAEGRALGGVEKAQEEDVALVLHTSGTTGRPKAVPLTHRNLTRAMVNIIDTYQLSTSDRAYLVMPLFHVHGLLAGLLAPLASGGTVIVPPKFSVQAFWRDFIAHGATWYTAVPTIHQILLKSPLPSPIPKIRFIRSCSSPLSPVTFHALEKALGAPVLEAYAMTEAAHQMTSNPLPPAQRKPGTVGLGQGVEVAIMDDAGAGLPTGTEGEICIRGTNVTSGYINNPTANAASFTPTRFFRTGDQGKKDQDGYVYITGRIKELINRGGEKISPVEVDNAISSHPKVAEAVSFAVQSDMYGQEVAVAVVVKENTAPPTVEELKAFVAKKLAKFKIPTKWFFTHHMPKTATGKVQRRMVAEAMLKPKAKL